MGAGARAGSFFGVLPAAGLFGFEKDERATIDERELVALQKLAASLLTMDRQTLDRQVAEGELSEICHEE